MVKWTDIEPVKHGTWGFFREGCRCNSCTIAAVVANPKVAENLMAINIGRDSAREMVKGIMTTHTNDSVFASDLDRNLVCDQISHAAAEGRLTPDEHEELIGRALASRRRGELRRLIEGLPNPKLPDLPTTDRPPTSPPSPSIFSLFAPIVGVAIFLTVGVLMWLSIGAAFNGNFDDNSTPTAVPANPTPAASITDPQDRAFVQTMIDYHNSATFADPYHPTDVDETAVLDIAHKLRNPANDVRQQFLLIMDSNAYKGLTAREKYRAGKVALSVWRAGDEAAWVGLGKDNGYE